MTAKRWYAIGIIVCFLVGAYLWKITHTTVKPIERLQVPGGDSGPGRQGILVYVADDAISSDDLDFEFRLHTKGMFDSTDLDPKPELGANKVNGGLTPLKEKLLTGIIERKLLFHLVGQDSSFTIDDPSRFTSCLANLQQTIKEAGLNAFSAGDQERLKERLCERSILEQYFKEKIVSKIQNSDAEIKAYYQEHKKDFVKPKRVLIRQIVTEKEEQAKALQHKLNHSNFGQMAKDNSITPEASNGGLIGPFAQGEMPRFFDLAFSLAKGEIYGVIKSPYGYHIIMLEERYSKTEETLEQARGSISAILTETKRKEEYKKWLETAINAVPVKTPGSKI